MQLLAGLVLCLASNFQFSRSALTYSQAAIRLKSYGYLARMAFSSSSLA
ncbi:MAG: hypothetical protein RLZZ69_6 [Cyanobacteriota bacterium]|jgi:hypothetical protein